MNPTPDPDERVSNLFPPPFPNRDHHTDPCPGCGHVLGTHAIEWGCVQGWKYNTEGQAIADGCECRLTLATEHDPPSERDL